MPSLHRKSDVLFDGSATYRIIVKGRIEEFWSENLGGMSISYQSDEDDPDLTILAGQLQDQAELIGVLTSIYEMHLSILSVESIKTI